MFYLYISGFRTIPFACSAAQKRPHRTARRFRSQNYCSPSFCNRLCCCWAVSVRQHSTRFEQRCDDVHIYFSANVAIVSAVIHNVLCGSWRWSEKEKLMGPSSPNKQCFVLRNRISGQLTTKDSEHKYRSYPQKLWIVWKQRNEEKTR